ncbi:MAG: cytochrome c [candidate division NC10 bacterium]|nr:cytochrome c [candidate division NC10 bacterium]
MAAREPRVLRRALLLSVAVAVAAAHASGELWIVPVPIWVAHAASDSKDGQVAAGQAVYVKHCARCHGEKGEGIEAPALFGQAENPLVSYPNAAILYRYVRFLMPLDAPDSLAERDYWAVVAYLLVRNGVIRENVPVGPETAEQIVIKR